MFITVDGKKTYYQQKGEGQPLLFVHGWGGSINSLECLSQLACRYYQTITLDLPGFGKTDPPDQSWGVEEYSRFLINLLKKLGLSKINYFGHSFGGSLGIFIASKYPQVINKLILCSSSYKRTKTSSKLTRFFKKTPPWLKKIFYRVVFPRSDLFKFPKLESNFRKIITQDLTSYLDQIKTPTLILWGAEDRETPLPQAKELQQKIRNSQLKIFPNTGHNLPLKYPEKVFREIKNFCS